MTRATFFKHFELLADQPDGVAKMRELVLELAVRGQLVSQAAKDEPASELLKRTEAEKAKAVKAGEVRKQEPLPPVEDDAPFDIPKGWQWTRLGNTGRIFNGNSVSESGKAELAKVEKGLPFIATKDVGYGREALVYENGLKVRLGDSEFKVAHANAVLICAEGGSAGRKLGIADRDICFGNKLYANEVWSGISHRWIFYVYQSPAFFKEFASRMTGIIGGIARSEFHLLPIPIPPENEQRRIVAKVDELMALCDELEQQQQARQHASGILQQSALHHLLAAREPQTFAAAWQRVRDHFLLLHDTPDAIPQLRQAILQLAVQGRLVPQNLEDESGTALFAKIQAHKKRLVIEKKIKVAKQLPPIDDSELRHQIPSNWCWARLADVCETITDGTHQTPKYTDSGRMFLSAQNVKPFRFMPDKHRFVSEQDYAGYIKNRKPEYEDILLTRVGAGIGEAAVIDQHLDFAIYVSIALIRPAKDLVNPYFTTLWLNSPHGTGNSREFTYGVGVSQGNLNLGQIQKFVFPLPPLAEQKRIVARVEELLRWCDTLAAQLHQTRTLGAHLLASTLHQILAA